MDPDLFKHVDIGLDENGELIYSKDGGKTARRVVPGVTSPLDLPRCQFWLDASQLNLEDDDPVSSWPDLSPNGYNAEQDVEVNQPVFKTNKFGDLPAVRFVGGDSENNDIQFLSLSGDGLNLFRNLSGVTMAVVALCDVTDFDSGGYALLASDGSSTGKRRAVIDPDSGFISFELATEDDVDGANIQANARVPVFDASDDDAVYCGIFVADLIKPVVAALDIRGYNDSGLSFGEPPGPTPDTPSVAITIGGWVDPESSSLGFGGHISEMIVYNRVLDIRERQQLLEYLSAKWSII